MRKHHLLAAAVAVLIGAGNVPAWAKTDTFGFSSNGLSFPFAAAIANGFADAAKKAGVKTIVLDAQGGVEKQANDIQDLIAQKVDGLAIMALDSVVAKGWVDRAVAANIPVVGVATVIGDPMKSPREGVYPKLSAFAGQDEIAAGRAAGEMAKSLLPPGKLAKIAVIEGAAGYAEVRQRRQGFQEGLKAAGVDYKIVASQPGDWTAEKGQAACQNILQSNPGVSLFFNESDDMAVGCALAVRAAGSDAKVIGMGGSKLAIASIRAGRMAGTVCYKPLDLGALAFRVLYDDVSGKATHKAEFVTYPTPAVTRANLDQCAPQW